MKHTTLRIIAAVVVLLTALAACKPTEQNYRNAYEAARLKQDQSGGLDSTIYSRLRPQGDGAKLVAGSDTLTMHTITIGYPEDAGASATTLHRYNVVVGQFKQIFNARAMRQRLINDGYEGAMILQTREPLYYVVAESCVTPEGAAEAIRRVGSDSRLTIRTPFPWILRPAHMAR